MLVTTHFMDEAEYCDRLALILDGYKIAEGAPDELKASAATAATPDPTLEDAFIRLIKQGREGAANENSRTARRNRLERMAASLRDPSALMIAFVLPAILLFIFGFDSR